MLDYRYIDKGVTFNSVKIPLTLFNEGPLGIKPETEANSEHPKGIHYNGTDITLVNPFINAVDIDWNKLEVEEDVEIRDTAELINWIKGLSILSEALKNLDETFKVNPEEKSILIYNTDYNKWEYLTYVPNVPLTSVTSSELNQLIESNSLIPGRRYRITDYIATTSYENTSVATGLLFDIIVTADSKNTLNENAKAVQNENDSYFYGNNLSAWELKYSNGTIYYLKDEFGNEASYDFKNILFNGKYTFNTLVGSKNVDASLSSECNNNIIKPFINESGDLEPNFIVIESICSDMFFEEGCNHLTFEGEENEHVLVKGGNLFITFKNSCKNVVIVLGTNSSSDNKDIILLEKFRPYWTILGTATNNTIVETNLLDLVETVSVINNELYKINLQEVTYEELVNLKENNSLLPGQLYRITDFVSLVDTVEEEISNVESVGDFKITYTYFQLASSAEHPFDIIVTADNYSKLNENARVVHHKFSEGESDYFENNNLSAWKIKYCLENNKSRFEWADEEGKGVIYYMKDEYNNECNYDFKNIIFSKQITEYIISDSEDNIIKNYITSPITYTGYTFSKVSDILEDASLYSTCYNNKNLSNKLPYNIFVANEEQSICDNTLTNSFYNILLNSSKNYFVNSSFNTIETNCQSNKFNDSKYNLLKRDSKYNIFLGNNINNILKENSTYNLFCLDSSLNELSNSSNNTLMGGSKCNTLQEVSNTQIFNGICFAELDTYNSNLFICPEEWEIESLEDPYSIILSENASLYFYMQSTQAKEGDIIRINPIGEEYYADNMIVTTSPETNIVWDGTYWVFTMPAHNVQIDVIEASVVPDTPDISDIPDDIPNINGISGDTNFASYDDDGYIVVSSGGIEKIRLLDREGNYLETPIIRGNEILVTLGLGNIGGLIIYGEGLYNNCSLLFKDNLLISLSRGESTEQVILLEDELINQNCILQLLLDSYYFAKDN